MVAPENEPPKTIPIWLKFVFGSCSGSISTTIVQPADLVKTRMQMLCSKGRIMSSFEVARDIVVRKGIQGLYVGYSAALLRQIIFSGCRLGGFNTAFDMYKQEYKKVPNFRTKVMLGIGTGVFGTMMSMPAEVALIRMTADGKLPKEQRRNYKNVFDAMGRMVREEGISALRRGFWPTLIRSTLLNLAQLATYAEAHEALLSTMGQGMALHFTASMISGLVATIATLPVDILKTRIQNTADRNATPLSILRLLIQKEGILAMWAGFLPTYVKIGPHTVITFMCLETFGEYYLKHIA